MGIVQLKQVTTIITQKLGEDWHKNIKEPESVDSFLDNLFKEVFLPLNLSVIAGEFLFHTNFTAEIIRIQDKLVQEIDNEIQEERFRLFGNQINYYLNSYLGLANDIHLKFENPNNTILFQIENNKLFLGKNNYIDYNNLFETNLHIAKLDFEVSVSEKTLITILSCKNILECSIIRDSFTAITEALIYKTRFLLKKIHEELQTDEVLHYKDKQNKNKKVDEEDLTIKYLHEFEKLTFFSDNTKTRKLSQRIHEIRQNNEKTFDAYHVLTVNEKEVNSSKEKLSSIIQDFENTYKAHEWNSTFDKNAYNISLNYLHNNNASLQLMNVNCNDIETINDIELCQSKTEIYNYFPYLKLIIHYVNQCNQEFAKDNKDFSQIGGIIQKIDNNLGRLSNNLEWSKKNLRWAFQPPYTECCKSILINRNYINVFIASAFIPIINYKKVDKQIFELKHQVQKLKTLRDVHQNLTAEKKLIDKALKEAEIAKKEALDSQKRSIEILSIFAAIVLFASGSIQIFSKIDTLGQALLFMLTFAAGLSTFVLLIKFIMSSKSDDSKPIKFQNIRELSAIIIITALLLTTVLLLIFSNISNTSINDSSIHTSKIDTVKIYKHDTVYIKTIIKDTIKH